PEEGDLEAQFRPALGLQPPRHVPPLLTVIRVRAMIAGKFKLVAGRYQGKGQARGKELPAIHQSSFTARTGPMPVASRPERKAVREESKTKSKDKPINSPYGRCTSMLQLNDCRLTTWISTRLMAPPSARPTATPSSASSPPSAASIAPIWPRVMPNSRRRASTIAPTLEERPNSPTSTATASSA